MKSCMNKVCFLVFLCAFLTSAPAWAQDATARILGNVTDPQGGGIPIAKVTVTNAGTHVSYETTTSKDGFFQVLALPIGTYNITIVHDGFRKQVFGDQTLQINQVLRIDVRMELGSITEVIEVREQASRVETVNATLGQEMPMSSVAGLPLNGRNLYDLALLLPGVVEVNPDSGGAGNFGIAGGRSDSVTFLLDGGMNNNLLSNGLVFNPSPDAVAEFRVLTSNYTAEYGRNGGGIVSAVTRSGTNQFHGSAYDFLRNDAFNANSFFNNAGGFPREVLKRNQFGATIGGPISIPKVVKGQDKFFFFASYQGQRQVQTVTTDSITVFTPAQLNGDFSSGGAAPYGAANCPNADPSVVALLKANPFFQSNSNKAQCGIIDPTKINSVAQKYIAAGLIPTSASGLQKLQGGSKNNQDQLTGRFDFNATTKDKISVTLGSSRNPTLNPFRSTSSDPFGYSVLAKRQTYFANIGYTKTFTSTLLNEFRFTTQRNNRIQAVPGKTLPSPAALGVGVTPDQSTGPTRLGFGSGMTIGFSSQGPTTLIDNTFTYADNLSWTRGHHNWRTGFTYSAYQNNTHYDFYVNGEFDFYGSGGGIVTNDFAAFLVGLPDEYFQFGAAPSNIRSHAYYAFGQDEWHIRKNLTLTLGVRYEYSSPKLDTKRRSFSLHLGQRSTVFPNAPIGVLFPGDQGAPLGANFPDKNDWAPRFGFAWDPGNNGKTSIRGGIGIFYDILKGEDNLQFNGQAPFFGFSDLFFNPLSANPTTETNYYTDPYGAVGVQNPFPSKTPAKNIDFDASGFIPFGGGGVYFVDPHLRTPYTYQYNLSVQRELLRDTVLEVSYVGSSSHKLTSLVDANPFVLGTFNRLYNTTPGNDVFSNVAFSYLGEFRNVSGGHFHSLETSLQKQISDTRILGRTSFILAYTFGHSIDNSSGFRERGSNVPAYNSRQFIASSDFDVKHRISFSGQWDLPFDRMWSSGFKRLTKGWSVYPIVTYRTGFPLDVFAGFSASRSKPGPSAAGDRDIVRANLVGSGVSLFDPHRTQTLTGDNGSSTGNFYFSPGNFTNLTLPSSAQAVADPSVRTYGSFPRNGIRGPGRVNTNFALAKGTPLFGERVRFLFRAEFFNLFNKAEFDNPDTSITSGTFGQVLSTADPRIIQLSARISF